MRENPLILIENATAARLHGSRSGQEAFDYTKNSYKKESRVLCTYISKCFMGQSKQCTRPGLPMARIHPTAIVEADARIGNGTKVLNHAHVETGATIGDECIIGEKTYVASDVRIGNCVKINPMAYICGPVIIEDGVLVSASTIFTNDRFPRATFPDLKSLRPPEMDEHTPLTLVREGATVGAGCVIGNDLEIGRWSMVGMGSIVTESIPDFHFVVGSPARAVGAVCKCGLLFHMFADR